MRRAGPAGALALAVTLAALAVVPSARAQDAPAAADADHLTLVGQTPWVVPGGAFALRVRVDDPPDGAELRVSVHRPVRTRSEFVRTLDGEGLRSRLVTGQPTALEALTPRPGGGVELRIVTGPVTGEPVDVELGPEDEGVYPVVVDLLDEDGELADQLVTHLVRLPDPDPDEFPLAAVVVVPLHAPPSHVGPGEVDPAILARLNVALDALADRPNVEAVLAPTPEAVAAAAEADPAAAARLAEVARGRTVLASTWVRVDEVAWARGGLARELDLQRAAGTDALASVLGTEPATDIALIPRGGGLDAVEAAVDAGARAVLVPEVDLEPLDEGDFPVTMTRPFEVEAGDREVPALMLDAGLDARIGATGDGVLDAHRLLADLAVLALDAPLASRAAVVALDDAGAADAAFLGALLAGLDQPARAGAAPLVVAADVRTVLDEVEPAGRSGGADPDDPLVRELSESDDPPSVSALREDLARARDAVASYRSVFGPSDRLAAEVDELILTAGSVAFDDTERDALLSRALGRLQSDLRQINPPPRQRVTLTAREGQVQLVLANNTDRPAAVTLELQGDRLEFPDHPDGRVLVNLAEATTTRVDLDVRARSSGDAPLDLRVLTPDGRVELGRTRVFVRTTAVSGVGIVLMAAAAVFLVVWWTRTIIRERGATRRRRPAHASGS